jgi:hypothetical protein
MSLTRPSRLAVLGTGVAVLALIAAMLLVNRPAGTGGPEILGAGGGLPVTAAESAQGPVDKGNGHFVGADQHHDTSAALRTIKPQPVHAIPLGDDEEDEDGGRDTKGSTNAPSYVQNTLAAPAIPAASKSFDGIPFPGVVCNCAPPDTNGEVGATQYLQIVNEGFQVFDKTTGASQYGPAAITTIWSGAGNVCATAGHGDPIVLYDQLAGRWLISQFAGGSAPTDECIAVSTTSDATGAWYRYDFHLGTNFMDYPHGAVWTDGYYFAFNVFNSAGTAFLGPQPVVFDRAKMLNGQAATFQTTGPRSVQDTFLPADIDGSALPPSGAPETFVSFPDFGTYSTYHYKIDWTTPTNSTWTTFAAPAAAGFTQLCATGSCVPQSGTTAKLDSLGDRLMFRLAYRNFGDHEAVVGNYSVSSGGVGGVRWFELRNVTSGPVTVYQESTYQPDTTWRWMGSAAMDKNGDIAVGFSASSASIVPGLRYAGRLVSDPLNSLAQGEAVLFAGAGSQSGTSGRWGDYADLTVDPVDDCTFWFTSEYYPTGVSQFNWRTRIGSFSFPSCTGTATTGSIGGHVTDSVSHAAISGATVSISGGTSTTTDSAGAYSIGGLTPASYSVTASASGHTTSAPANVAVTAGNTTTQDFALVPNPTTGSITGTVTNASGGAAISGATVTISGGASTTTNAAGVYTLSNLAPASYSVTASATGFVTSAPANVAVTAGNTTTQNFALTPNAGAHASQAFAVTAAHSTGGDGNGYETNETALTGGPDGAFATDVNSGSGNSTTCTSTARDKEVAGGYAFSNLGTSILGIQVALTGKVSSTKNTPRYCVQLSWDGGTSWTTGKSTANLKTTVATYTLGTTADTWGHAWTAAQLSSTSFKVRVIDLANSTARTFSLDSVSVTVTSQ